MFCSALLIPFRKVLFKYVTKFNVQEKFDYYTCFFGETKKVFINREWLESYEPIEFEGGTNVLLKNMFGNIWKEPMAIGRNFRA